jgi:hypothetical protein
MRMPPLSDATGLASLPGSGCHRLFDDGFWRKATTGAEAGWSRSELNLFSHIQGIVHLNSQISRASSDRGAVALRRLPVLRQMKAAYAALSACREGWLISGGYGGLHAERRRRSNPIVSSVLFDRNELVGQLLRPSPVGISSVMRTSSEIREAHLQCLVSRVSLNKSSLRESLRIPAGARKRQFSCSARQGLCRSARGIRAGRKAAPCRWPAPLGGNA